MKIHKIIQTTSTIGKEKIQHCLYKKNNFTLVVDTVSINGIKTAEVKDLFKKSHLIKTVVIYFNKAGKRIDKVVNLQP